VLVFTLHYPKTEQLMLFPCFSE